MRLALTGPRNYLLLEKGQRKKNGTRIEVLLREPFSAGQLTQLVSGWCRRVEFPVQVDDLGTQKTITAERKEQFTYEVPDIMHNGARFAVRAFDVKKHGVEGELYVFMRIGEEGESWDAWSDAQYSNPAKDPRASKPEFPKSLRCIHGIAVGEGYGGGPAGERLDFRGANVPIPALSREGVRVPRQRDGNRSDSAITSRWVQIMRDHLATSQRAKSPDGWRYKQALAEDFPTPDFWSSLPGTIPQHIRNTAVCSSLEETLGLSLFATVMKPHRVLNPLGLLTEPDSMPKPMWDEDTPAIFDEELHFISKRHTAALFQGRAVNSTRWLPSGHFAMYWAREAELPTLGGPSYKPPRLGKLDNSLTVGFRIHSISDSRLDSKFFNQTNPFVQWLLRVQKASAEGSHGITREQYARLYDMVDEMSNFFVRTKETERYIANWKKITGLPSDLYPPPIRFLPEMFARIPNPEAFSDEDQE